MTMDVQIKIDPAAAVAGADKATAAAAKTEDQLERTKKAAEGLSKAFGGLNEEFQRQAKILERIHGPAREFEAELKSLDILLDQGKISAKEYSSEVERLSRAMNQADGAASKASGGIQKMGLATEGVSSSAKAAAAELNKTSQKAGEFAKQSFAGVIGQLDKIAGIPIAGSATVMGFLAGGLVGAAAGAAISALGGLIEKMSEASKHTQTLAKEFAYLNSELLELEDLAGQPTYFEDKMLNALDPADAQQYLERRKKLAEQEKEIEKLRMSGIGGETAAKIRQEQFDRANAINDLEAAAARGLITEQAAIEKRNELFGVTEKATDATKALAEAMRKLREENPEFVKLLEGAGKAGAVPGVSRDPYKNYSHDAEVAKKFGDLEIEYSDDQGDIMADAEGEAKRQKARDDQLKKIEEEEKKAAEKAAEKAKERAEQIQKTNEKMIENFGNNVIEQLVKVDATASEVFSGIASEIAKMLLTIGISKGASALSSYLGGFSLGGAAHGGSVTVPHTTDSLYLPRFAMGGSMQVGGSGGVDSKIAMFRVSPGERIDVKTPEQQRQSQSAAAAPTVPQNLTIVMNREGVVTHKDLPGLVIKVLDDQAPAIRSRLTGR